MKYYSYYKSEIGNILLLADESALEGLWFEGASFFPVDFNKSAIEKDVPILIETKRYLDIYFTSREPDFTPALKLTGSPFAISVLKELLLIPYGQTSSYLEIARKVNSHPRSVARAIAHNKISIIIPCHRVIGSNGSLTGYAGGIERKRFLLLKEGVKL